MSNIAKATTATSAKATPQVVILSLSIVVS
jgi:hypothetical protein